VLGLVLPVPISVRCFSRHKPSLDISISPFAARNRADLVGLTDDLATVVGSLSHGRQRQLDIGMAIAPSPALLLLDEPAAGLSPGDRVRLADVLESLPRTVTMMLIEHDMDVALRIADRVTVMAEGAQIASGTPSEIRADAKVQAVYLGGHQ
jgi:branched-chain amino acid transport system ATP-binding protein